MFHYGLVSLDIFIIIGTINQVSSKFESLFTMSCVSIIHPLKMVVHGEGIARALSISVDVQGSLVHLPFCHRLIVITTPFGNVPVSTGK